MRKDAGKGRKEALEGCRLPQSISAVHLGVQPLRQIS